ncbi:MAG: hypothetical protein WAU28_01540 [Candidatus Moraniibacteriota bacterium]
MQPRDILNTATILFLAIMKSFLEWIVIMIMVVITMIMLFSANEPDANATLESGVIEIIIGGEYALATGFFIWNTPARNHTFYFFLMGASIVIATSVYLLLGSYFVFCLFLGSVGIWYQITLTQLRPATTTPD